MPQIDVTDLLFDPDIAGEPFTVIRRQETVNQFGESVVTTATLTGFGSITPTGDNSLVRADAYTTQSDTIEVITTFLLRGPSSDGGQKFQPDLVVWKGAQYVVRVLNDFTQYGAGFVAAECMAENLISPATTGPTGG